MATDLPPLRITTGAALGEQVHVGNRPIAVGMLPLHMRDSELSPDRQVQYCHRPLLKPGGGLWTSSYAPVAPHCDWLRWCGDGMMPEKAQGCPWLLTPCPDARLLEINDEEDLYAIVGRFLYPYTRHRHPMQRYGRAWDTFDEIDHCAVAEAGYAGVHLTDDGQWATRLTMPLNLYGWDCESTIWYRWAFAGKARLRKLCAREGPTDAC